MTLLATAKPHHPAMPVGDPLAFYSTAATVLPLLFLALAYQANILEESPFLVAVPPSRPSKLDRVFNPERTTLMLSHGVLVLTVLSEVLAFAVLARRVPVHRASLLIGGVMYIAGVVLLFQRTVLAMDARRKARNLPPNRSAQALVSFAFMVVLLTGMLVFLVTIVEVS
jgi:hypothetical protein